MKLLIYFHHGQNSSVGYQILIYKYSNRLDVVWFRYLSFVIKILNCLSFTFIYRFGKQNSITVTAGTTVGTTAGRAYGVDTVMLTVTLMGFGARVCVCMCVCVGLQLFVTRKSFPGGKMGYSRTFFLWKTFYIYWTNIFPKENFLQCTDKNFPFGNSCTYIVKSFPFGTSNLLHVHVLFWGLHLAGLGGGGGGSIFNNSAS